MVQPPSVVSDSGKRLFAASAGGEERAKAQDGQPLAGNDAIQWLPLCTRLEAKLVQTTAQPVPVALCKPKHITCAYTVKSALPTGHA